MGGQRDFVFRMPSAWWSGIWALQAMCCAVRRGVGWGGAGRGGARRGGAGRRVRLPSALTPWRLSAWGPAGGWQRGGMAWHATLMLGIVWGRSALSPLSPTQPHSALSPLSPTQPPPSPRGLTPAAAAATWCPMAASKHTCAAAELFIWRLFSLCSFFISSSLPSSLPPGSRLSNGILRQLHPPLPPRRIRGVGGECGRSPRGQGPAPAAAAWAD